MNGNPPDFWTEIIASLVMWYVVWGWFIIPISVFVFGMPAMPIFKTALCALVYGWLDRRIYTL